MSERGYFSQRNLIPGSAFLIVFLAYNYALIMELFNQQYSALLGVAVALLGSPTLGFLISQLWWWYFQSKTKLYEWKPIAKLREKYNLSENLNKRETLVIYDYVLHKGVHSGKGSKGLSSYAFRRYDNYVLLSTTRLSLTLGTLIGIAARVASENYVHGFSSRNIVASLIVFITGSEFFVLVSLTIAVMVLFVAISKGLEWIKFDYEEMHSAIIIDSTIKEEELRAAFPLYYAPKVGEKGQKPCEENGKK